MIFSDHLASVRMAGNPSIPPHVMLRNPARSLYRWMHDLIRRFASTTSTTLPDTSHLPTLPHSIQLVPTPPQHPISSSPALQTHPLSSINTIHTKAHTSANNTPANLNRLADRAASSAQSSLFPSISAPLPTFTMDTFTLYTDLDGWIESSIPNFINDRLLRLDTAERLARRLPDVFDPRCRMGCPTIETEHHIFVACPSFAGLREDAAKQLVSQTITILD
ncbi:hypothetical protein H0H92_013611, partial [Tricholoma furcatifolium]